MPGGPRSARGSREDPAIQPFINKTVPFRFRGVDLRFHLSHGLFSSFDVDDGTRLLLKSLAQGVDLGSLRSVLDVGCGVGVIGACVGRHAAGARLVLQDRDALAAAVAGANCAANGLAAAQVDCRLAFHGLEERRFDLVVSNIPAKAGEPVLRAFFRHAAGALSEKGLAAVVIVAPLASMARQAMNDLGCLLRHEEDTPAYSVFHFAAGAAKPETDGEREDLAPYIRAASRFAHDGWEYELETVHGLPDFDTRGHPIALALDLLEEAVPGDDGKRGAVSDTKAAGAARSFLFWNPGQGHVAAAAARAARAAAAITLVSRDCLEGAITTRNLVRMGLPPAAVHFRASEEEISRTVPSSSVDLLVAVPHPVPRVPWQAGLARSALQALKPDGSLLVVGTSTEMHRFREQARGEGLALQAAKKRAGYRSLLLRKQRS